MTDAQSQTAPKDDLPLALKDMAPAPTEAPPVEPPLTEAPLSPTSQPEAPAEGSTGASTAGEAASTPKEKPAPQPPPPPFRVEFQLPVAMYPNVTPKILLRGCQSEAILAWRESKLKRKIISLPTGCGKTVTALAIASETTVGRVLWLAHRNELIEQPMLEVIQSFPDLEAGIVKAGANDNMARLVIGSVQTVSKRRRLKNIAEGSPFSLVVIDEAHHSTSKIYKGILEALGCFDEGGPDVLGLTATVERADKVSLGEVFEDIVYSISISEAIDAGYLVPPKPLKVPLAIDPKSLRVVDADGEKDFNQADLEKELARVNAARATALAIKEHAADKKTIVFTVSVDQAKRTAAELQALGMKAAWASGAPHMTDAQRKDVISKLAKREINVVCNAQLLCEGFDDKEIDCVVIARPTRSKAVYIQEVGRGLRLAPHKRECLVIDIVGASDLGLVTIDAYLQETKKKTPRKRREPREGPPDPEMEWKRIRSYLKSARVDLVPHGEATFARASDGLLVTVTADGEMLMVRRKAGDDNLWVIERKGIEFTPPADIHATMDAACMLSREYGGTVAPGSEKWNAATEKQVPDAH